MIEQGGEKNIPATKLQKKKTINREGQGGEKGRKDVLSQLN